MSERQRGGGQGRRLRRRLLGGQGRGVDGASRGGLSSGGGSQRGGRGVGGGRLSDRSALLAVVGLVVEDLRRPDGLLRSGMRWVTDRLEQGRLRGLPYRSLPGSVIDVKPTQAQRAIASGCDESQPAMAEGRPTISEGERAEDSASSPETSDRSGGPEATRAAPGDGQASLEDQLSPEDQSSGDNTTPSR